MLRTLLSRDGYELLLGPQGFALYHGGRSLLGPFQLRAEGQDGQPLLLTSEAALYTLTTTPDGSIELRYPAADGSGLLWIVHARLDQSGLLLWQSLRNQSIETLTLSVLRLIAHPTPDSFVTGAGTQTGWQVFRTGYSSFSPSFAVDSRFRPEKPLFPTAGAFNQHSQSEYYGNPDCLSSPWMLTLTEPGPTPQHLLLGFVSAKVGLGELALRRERTVSIEARLGLEGRQLAVGETLVGDKLLIAISRDEQALLSFYTDVAAQEMSARVPALPVPSGWCSWYYYYTRVTEGDVTRNLTALKERKLPVKYVQLDDGYQHKIGDWLSANAKFPSGLGGLARQIKQAGFVPGIWLAPFFVQRSSEIFRKHRDWLLRDEDGKLRRIGYHPFWGITDGLLYCLDLTHPQVLAWLRRVFSTLCELGFEYFKIDFLFAGLRLGRRYDPSLTPLEAYRQGLRIIRETIGDRFLLGCGAPLLASVGFCDAMRISPDVKEDWRDPMVELIAHGTGYPSAELALQNCLTRAHLHGKWWLNDPDCVLVRRDKSSLTLPEVQTLLSVMSLSGGMLLLSDDVRALPKERLQLVQMALPPSGRTGQAMHVLTEERPQRFVYVGTDQTGTPTGLVTLVNWQDGPRELTLSAESIGLPTGSYHAFELWTKRHQRLAPGQSIGLRVAPHGSALWLLRKASSHPQVVGLSHHLWQTLLLLEHESFDSAQHVLKLTLRPLAVGDGELRIAVPAGLRLDEVNGGRGEMTVKNQGTYSEGVVLLVAFDTNDKPIEISLRFAPLDCIKERT